MFSALRHSRRSRLSPPDSELPTPRQGLASRCQEVASQLSGLGQQLAAAATSSVAAAAALPDRLWLQQQRQQQQHQQPLLLASMSSSAVDPQQAAFLPDKLRRLAGRRGGAANPAVGAVA